MYKKMIYIFVFKMTYLHFWDKKNYRVITEHHRIDLVPYPVDILCQNDVDATSSRPIYVNTTSFYVMCPIGRILRENYLQL